MKKNLIKIIVLILLVAILIVPYIVNSEGTPSPTISITGSDGKQYTLSDNSKINILTYGPYTYTTNVNSSRSILEQDNVFCVEPGANLTDGEFQASKNQKVTDNILAYILSQKKETMNVDGTIKNKPHICEPVQIALWIKNNNKTEAELLTLFNNKIGKYANSTDTKGNKTYKQITKIILNPYIQYKDDKTTINTTNTFHKIYEKANSIVKAATEYNNRLSTSDNTLNLSLDNNQIKVEVGGSYIKSYRIIVNGVDTGKDYTEKTQNIDIPNDAYTNETGKVTVSVKINRGIIYKVNYRELTRYQQQKIWAINSNTVADIKIVNKEITVNTDISLQKYITKVNGENLTLNQTELINRENMKTYSDETDIGVKDKIYYNSANKKDVSANNTYKYDNRVKIEIGDTVTYRVHIYNNSRIRTSNIHIVDSLPAYYTSEKELKSYVSIENIIDNNGNDVTSNWNSIAGSNQIKYEGLSLNGYESTYFDITVKFNVQTKNVLENTAWISSSSPINKEEYRTVDRDYIEMEEYAVSLEKYVSKVTDTNGTEKTINAGITDRAGKAEYLTKNTDDTYVDNTKNDSKWTQHNYDKYNNVVTDISKGDYVTYTIKVTNDSNDTSVYISEVIDYLPDGVKYSNIEYNGEEYNKTTDNAIKFNDLAGTLLKPGESASFTVTVEVIEPNMSVEIMKNTAKITKIKNTNGTEMDADKCDSTPYNNEDSDYFQMKDITISGTVWNDVAWDKAQKDYNGIYDNEEGKDKLLNSSINVYLYRVEQDKEPEIVGETSTDSSNGQYSFSQDNLNHVSDQIKKYIKGPQVSSTAKRWNGNYYSYYVVFEYDGVTYTSTKFADVTSDNPLDSNARERLDGNEFDGYVNKNRTDFNNGFNTINNESGIKYTTKNESGYIPQSIHEYNPSTMSIQSSTMLISLSNDGNLEQQLKHVNLGLRGRDTFDLKLATDVYSTQVTVNKVPGVYQYNNNKVTLRRGDLSNNYNYVEDAANIYSESSKYVENKDENSYDQDVRKTDIKNEKYGSTGLEIQVTYKITVQNVSTTDGTATQITDYYDDKYTFIRAYGDNNQTLSTSSSTTGTGYKSVVITTPSTNLTTTDGGTSTMNIYLVFDLTNAEETLKQFLVDGKTNLPTFNIAEITEYKTQCANGQDDSTRGLLDINSAPGSIDKEQARLITTEGQNTPTINGNPTTVGYYFEKARAYLNDRTSRELNNLKYEDDTAAAPILYFTSSDSERTITGTVFEDKTTTNPTTRIKTGNGKLDEGEVGVYGATVELVEISTNKNPQDIAENEGTIRYTVNTNKDGQFTISGFLPGYYVIRYRYGDTTDTVLLHQGGEGINKQSYNGEDYQSTNNAFEVKDTNGNIISNILDRSKNLWYVMNKDKGISTATDNSSERTTVSDKVTGFTDEKMTVLNNMRDMIGTYDKNDDTLTANRKYNINKEIVEIPETKVSGIRDVIEDTKMYATTPQMLFTVEQTINLNELGDKKQALINSKEIIVNSTYSDLGEWAMFPDANNEHYKSYLIENMNFGIAEVPVTTIDLQKTVQAFNLTDSTGNNTIASVVKNNSGKWELKGDVYDYPGAFDVSVEDEKLQGARLQVTYGITSNITVERNYDQKGGVEITINGLNDIIDNNLSYNANLRDNSAYWEITTMEKSSLENVSNYTNIMKANKNALEKINKGETIYITLEKILSSTDSTIEEIITSTVDIYAYNNIVEITGINYKNVTPPNSESSESEQRDRVRTPDRYIILPGIQHDSATAEVITIHPPTGDSSISIMYYVIAVISLVVLAAGVFGIKKFVLTNRKS